MPDEKRKARDKVRNRERLRLRVSEMEMDRKSENFLGSSLLLSGIFFHLLFFLSYSCAPYLMEQINHRREKQNECQGLPNFT